MEATVNGWLIELRSTTYGTWVVTVAGNRVFENINHGKAASAFVALTDGDMFKRLHELFTR